MKITKNRYHVICQCYSFTCLGNAGLSRKEYSLILILGPNSSADKSFSMTCTCNPSQIPYSLKVPTIIFIHTNDVARRLQDKFKRKICETNLGKMVRTAHGSVTQLGRCIFSIDLNTHIPNVQKRVQNKSF